MGSVRVLYTVRKRTEEQEEVLFYERMRRIAESYAGSRDVDFRFVLYETAGGEDSTAGVEGHVESKSVQHVSRRIKHGDLLECLGPEEARRNTVVYVCGPPKMTDEYVEVFGKAAGMEERRVLCEKWW